MLLKYTGSLKLKILYLGFVFEINENNVEKVKYVDYCHTFSFPTMYSSFSTIFEEVFSINVVRVQIIFN